MIARRRLLAGAAVTAALGRPARAASTTSLRLLVGAPAGSVVDQSARAFAPFLQRHLPGTEIGVANLPGLGGLVCYRALAGADPSGAVLGWVSTPALAARMVDRGGGDLLDRLRLIGAVQEEPIVIVSPASSPLANAAELIARSAENAEAVPIGTPQPGTAPHLAVLRLQRFAGTRLNVVAFPSATAAHQAALAGTVAAAALGLIDAVESLRGGKLVGLGISAEKSGSGLPDLPPLGQLGLPIAATIWRGLVAPSALPNASAEPIAVAMRRVVDDPEWHDEADSKGFTAAFLDGPAWTARARAERAELAELWQLEPWLSGNND
jgi:tripartite-type tricarboxylate transporter receptor subunit TctC